MSFFRNILHSNKPIDTDMEADGHSDIELDDMEAGSRSAHNAESLNPDSVSALDLGSTFSYSFPAPNFASEGSNHAPPFLQMNLASPLSVLPPAQIGKTLNINGKRSQNDDRINKVRVVEQGSKIPIIVHLYFPLIFNCMGFL